MSNISKIRISGNTYQLKDEEATNVVELTQAEYDQLPSSAKTSNTLFIITDAQGADLSNYYTKSETSGATEISTALASKADAATTYSKTEVDTALASKQTTLTAGTNITIVDNVISATGGGGGGKAISGGTNISITTGETADTINCTLPIYINQNVNKGDINIGTDNNANYDYYRIAIGRKIDMSSTHGGGSIAIGVPTNNTSVTNKCYGEGNVAIGREFQIGASNTYSGARWGCVAIGDKAKSLINQGVAIGSETTVSGTTKTNINNQLKIDASNQVYIYNKDNTEMICLQDHLGGGGSSYSAGTNIDITNDIISCTLNASNGDGAYSFKEGWATYANNRCAHAEGEQTIASGLYSHAEGYLTTASAYYSHAEGYNTNANNQSEHASGQFNNSVTASTTFGDSGNTLFSVGNGTSNSARHNAFEIRQNGDIYITSGGTDIKLQDNLGGGTVDQTIISGSTNAVAGGAVYSKIDEVEQVTAAALNNINDRLSEDEEVTAAGLNAVNSAFGGLKLQQITQNAYDSLTTKDPSTLYIIVN